jgi:hypothetical protein
LTWKVEIDGSIYIARIFICPSCYVTITDLDAGINLKWSFLMKTLIVCICRVQRSRAAHKCDKRSDTGTNWLVL